jgi:hypothetical protein
MARERHDAIFVCVLAFLNLAQIIAARRICLHSYTQPEKAATMICRNVTAGTPGVSRLRSSVLASIYASQSARTCSTLVASAFNRFDDVLLLFGIAALFSLWAVM